MFYCGEKNYFYLFDHESICVIHFKELFWMKWIISHWKRCSFQLRQNRKWVSECVRSPNRRWFSALHYVVIILLDHFPACQHGSPTPALCTTSHCRNNEVSDSGRLALHELLKIISDFAKLIVHVNKKKKYSVFHWETREKKHYHRTVSIIK